MISDNYKAILNKSVFIISVLSILLFAGCSAKENAYDNTASTGSYNDGEYQSPGYATKSTGSTSQGDVLLEITPISTAGSEWIFEISMNTHSVDLSSYDLLSSASLIIGDDVISPEKAPELRGHHVSGEIVFDVNSSNDSFVIEINNIPAVKTRVFSWGGGI